MSAEQRHIMIVGGVGSTIGRAIIERLLENTRNLVTSTHLTSADDSIKSDRLRSYRLDVRDHDMVKRIVNDTWTERGPVDVLINNAGILSDAFCPVLRADAWLSVIDTNLTGVFNVCKFISRKMIPRKGGSIINIASYKGLAGCSGQVNYSASKAGVIALTRSLARELAPFRISVNAVCPGFVPSQLNEHGDEKIRQAMNQSLFGIEHNLADVAVFTKWLASGELRGVSGQVFCSDSRIYS